MKKLNAYFHNMQLINPTVQVEKKRNELKLE